MGWDGVCAVEAAEEGSQGAPRQGARAAERGRGPLLLMRFLLFVLLCVDVCSLACGSVGRGRVESYVCFSWPWLRGCGWRSPACSCGFMCIAVCVRVRDRSVVGIARLGGASRAMERVLTQRASVCWGGQAKRESIEQLKHDQQHAQNLKHEAEVRLRVALDRISVAAQHAYHPQHFRHSLSECGVPRSPLNFPTAYLCRSSASHAATPERARRT